jgi:hypothetical protein
VAKDEKPVYDDDSPNLNELGIIEYEKGTKNSYAEALKYLLKAEKLKIIDFVGCHYIG